MSRYSLFLATICSLLLSGICSDMGWEAASVVFQVATVVLTLMFVIAVLEE